MVSAGQAAHSRPDAVRRGVEFVAPGGAGPGLEPETITGGARDHVQVDVEDLLAGGTPSARKRLTPSQGTALFRNARASR